MNIFYTKGSKYEINRDRRYINRNVSCIEVEITDNTVASDRYNNLYNIIESMNENDTVYLCSLTVLGYTINEIFKHAKAILGSGANIIAVKEDINTNNNLTFNDIIDKIMLLEEDLLERKLNKDKLISKIDKSNVGRKKYRIDNEFVRIYYLYVDKKVTKSKMAKELHVTRPTVDRLIKDFKKQGEKII